MINDVIVVIWHSIFSITREIELFDYAHLLLPVLTYICFTLIAMGLVTKTSYKCLSFILLVSGLYSFWAPEQMMSFLRSPATSHPLPVMLTQLLGLACVALSAAVCTATSNATSSRSIGAGLMLTGLLMVFVTASPDIIAVIHPACIFAASFVLSIIGMMGFFLAPTVRDEVGLPHVPADQSSSMKRYQTQRGAKRD